MTNQEIFDTVYLGLASQGFERSRSTVTGICAYRGDHGRKCAAGWLIPDEEYYPEMEKHIVNVVPFFSKYYSETSGFIYYLQRIHDMNATPSKMKLDLESWAAKNSLTIPEIPNA